MGILFLILIGLALGFTFANYNSKDPEGWEVYLIKRGSHRSLRINRPYPIVWKFAFQRKKTLRFDAMFGEGCDYDSNAIEDDINKLYGISYGGDPHWRSVRVGWRYNSNLKVVELFVYAYVKGKRYIRPLFNVPLYEEVSFVIMRHNKMSVSVSAKSKSGRYSFEQINGVDESPINYRLWPYFGGNTPAPQAMKLFIR